MVVDLTLFGTLSVFTLWILFLGGAEWLEGTVRASLLVHYNAPYWHATGIKLYVAITWLASLLWLALS